MNQETFTPIELQLAYEQQCITAGREKLTLRVQKNTKPSENLIKGSISRETLVEVAQTLKAKRLTAFAKGHTGTALGPEVVAYMTTAETEEELDTKIYTFVHFTIQELLNGAFKDASDQCVSRNFHDDSNIVTICEKIGKRVEMLSRLEILKDKDLPAYYQARYRFRDQVYGFDKAMESAKEKLEELECSWDDWSREIRVRVGRILLAFVFDTYPKGSCPFQIFMERIEAKTYNFVAPSEKTYEKASELFSLAWDKACEFKPMLVPPLNWSNDQYGGYLMNATMHRESFVRGHQTKVDQPQKTFDFINRIQRTAFTINPFILAVVNQLQQNGISIGKFVPLASLESKSLRSRRKTVRTEITLALANEFKSVPEFYIPWRPDFRGRIYPIPYFLSPQGTDFDKSLLMFAEGGPVTDRAIHWMEIEIATTFGGPEKLDKKSFAVRKQWTQDNIEEISKIATDPLGSISFWSEAEEPLRMLAACKEYYDCVITGTKKVTTLMCATDASCSGIQILSGLSLDKNAATLVNVIPGDAPQDAYTKVAEKAKTTSKLLDKEHIHLLMTRSVAKKVVMTIPYNASIKTNADQIAEALKEMDVEITFQEILAIAGALRDAMKSEDVLPGPLVIQEWMNSAVLKHVKAGNEVLRWTTPSGYNVVQECFEEEQVRLEGTLLGKTLKMHVAVSYKKDNANANKHKAAFMPNMIHSIDASLLCNAFHAFDKPVALIHDSVLARACDMDDAVNSLKNSYADIFSTEKDYLGYIAKLLGATKPAPPKETFDPEVVKKSEYFFA